MDLGFDLLLLAASLQFHQNVKFCEVLRNLIIEVASNKTLSYNWKGLKKTQFKNQFAATNLCLGTNDLKKFIGKQGVGPLLDRFHSMVCSIFDHRILYRNLTPTRLMSTCSIPN